MPLGDVRSDLYNDHCRPYINLILKHCVLRIRRKCGRWLLYWQISKDIGSWSWSQYSGYPNIKWFFYNCHGHVARFYLTSVLFTVQTEISWLLFCYGTFYLFLNYYYYNYIQYVYWEVGLITHECFSYRFYDSIMYSFLIITVCTPNRRSLIQDGDSSRWLLFVTLLLPLY